MLTEQWDIGFSLTLQSIKPRSLINASQNINEDGFHSVGTLRSNRDADRCVTDSSLVVIQVHNLGLRINLCAALKQYVHSLNIKLGHLCYTSTEILV